MTTEKEVQQEATRLGVPLSTYSPGDGITRYRLGSVASPTSTSPHPPGRPF